MKRIKSEGFNRCHSFIFIGGNCMNPLLSFKDVSKGFEDVQILNEINIDIEPSYFYTLLGPSGCENNNFKTHSRI